MMPKLESDLLGLETQLVGSLLCLAAGCAGFSAPSSIKVPSGRRSEAGAPCTKKPPKLISSSHEEKKRREAETHCDVEHHVAVAVLS